MKRSEPIEVSKVEETKEIAFVFRSFGEIERNRRKPRFVLVDVKEETGGRKIRNRWRVGL